LAGLEEVRQRSVHKVETVLRHLEHQLVAIRHVQRGVRPPGGDRVRGSPLAVNYSLDVLVPLGGAESEIVENLIGGSRKCRGVALFGGADFLDSDSFVGALLCCQPNSSATLLL